MAGPELRTGRMVRGMMTLDDPKLLDEIRDVVMPMGLPDDARRALVSLIEHDPFMFLHDVEVGGVEHAIGMKLALMRGFGLIDRNNEYLLGSGDRS
jgi:hypothetical protein